MTYDPLDDRLFGEREDGGSMTTEKKGTSLTYDGLLEMQEAEIKPIEARYRKAIRKLQERCPHRDVESTFPDPRYLRCLVCRKEWLGG